MPIQLTDIPGIGPHSASTLAAHGYNFTEDLAETTVEKLAGVPGFGTARASQIITSAKEIVAAGSKEEDVLENNSTAKFKVKKVKKLKKKAKLLTKKKKKKENKESAKKKDKKKKEKNKKKKKKKSKKNKKL